MNNFLKKVYDSNWLSGILAGILLGLSYSPVNIALLTIPAFMLLFRVIDRCESARQVMYYTYPAFLVWNIITTYWLVMATLVGGIAAILANSVLMTIPLAVIFHIRKSGFSPILVAALSASAWVSYEFLHLQWDLAWPWLIVGNAYANFPSIVQYISITGVMGISFWVIFSAAFLQPSSHQPTKNGLFTNLAIISLLPVMSIIYHAFATYEPDRFVEIVVVQPNYDSYLHNSGYDDTAIALEELIALTDSVRTPATAAIFWPENAIMDTVFPETYRYPSNRLLSVASDWNTPIISGATWLKYYDDGDAPRVFKENMNERKYNVYNAAAGFYPDGTVRYYEKAKLVPIVERLPFVNTLVRLENPWIDWGQISGYGRGSEIINYPVADLLSPALVCYDSVFPDWTRRFVKEGADFLTIITNDGWWGNTSGHVQHYDYARLRAIENRRTVLRSANNGVSGMIYASGKVHSRTDYWTQTALNLQVPVHSGITLYTRLGDWIGYLSLLVVVVFGVQRRFFRKQ